MNENDNVEFTRPQSSGAYGQSYNTDGETAYQENYGKDAQPEGSYDQAYAQGGQQGFNAQFAGGMGPMGPGWQVPPYAPRRRRRKTTIAVIAVIVVVVLICAGIFTKFVMGGSSDAPDYGGGEPYIGVLHAEGTIQSSSAAGSSATYQQNWLIKQVDYMMKDSSNKGILLYVNSPGGAVYQADELYLKLSEYQKETERPFYAYFAETAASGGYYIAAGADKISANRNCMTGSIGVYVGPIIDASELLSKVGIKAELIKSAENKAMGNYYSPMTDEQRAIYQSYVDECYNQFVEIVSQGRGLSDEVTRTLADGRIYTAAQAKENGLIDEVSDYETAKDEMLKENKLSCKFTTVKYSPSTSIYNMLLGMSDAVKQAAADFNKSDAQTALELLEDNSHYTVSYMMY